MCTAFVHCCVKHDVTTNSRRYVLEFGQNHIYRRFFYIYGTTECHQMSSLSRRSAATTGQTTMSRDDINTKSRKYMYVLYIIRAESRLFLSENNQRYF
jgi:hypothetical protein